MRGRNVSKLLELMERRGLSGVLLASHENVEYFIDVEVLGESPVLAHVSSDGYVEMYVPALEYYRYRDSIEYKNSKVYGVSKALKLSEMELFRGDWKDVVERVIKGSEPIGVDKSHYSPLSSILSSISSERVVDISRDIDEYRVVKEDWEVKAMSEAIDIVGEAIYKIADSLNERTTEVEAAGLFEYYARKRGIRRYAFEPLVLFKPGNSYPHNLPSNRELGPNNLVLLDLGVKHLNRCCDITRMIVWNQASSEEREAIEVVLQAIDRALEIVQPGVKASEVDVRARKYIEERGYGNKFIHGLGHGIGVVVHERPYIRPDSDSELKAGMVFTIEPGIYLAGNYGVRVEEDVLVTKTGVKVLSSSIERVLA